MSYRKLALVHGLIYLVSGLWPVVSIGSFMVVTGPKVDMWLVQTVGLLIASIGIVLLSSIRLPRLSLQVFLIAALPPFVLGAIDLIYVSVNRISPVYLWDALLEFGLVVAWCIASRTDHRIHVKSTDVKPQISSQPKKTEAEIDESIAETFPASDPPSWTLGLDPKDK